MMGRLWWISTMLVVLVIGTEAGKYRRKAYRSIPKGLNKNGGDKGTYCYKYESINSRATTHFHSLIRVYILTQFNKNCNNNSRNRINGYRKS